MPSEPRALRARQSRQSCVTPVQALTRGVGVLACPPDECGRRLDHLDAVDRAGWQAKRATGAKLGDDRVQPFRAACNRIDRASPDAMRAADAQVGHDAGDFPRRLDAARRIKRHNRPTRDPRQQDNAGGTSRRTAIDRRLLVDDRLGIRFAPCESALRALGLGQQAIKLSDLFVAISLIRSARVRVGHRAQRWVA